MMSKQNIQLSKGDVDTILFALSILPAFQARLCVGEVQADINTSLCISAAEKLIYRRSDLSANERRIILASLSCVLSICRGEIDASANDRTECGKYFFSVNSLVSRIPDPFSY